jgi:c-di-GMP-binding flagellar brake protein YcgR
MTVAAECADTRSELITLAEAQLHMGDLVQLQSQSHESDVRYTVALIGLSKGRSVLVTTPKVDGQYLLMREGQPFVLRAFSGKRAIAFSTHIIKSVNTPYPYLHLAYPRQVKTLVVRQGARAAVRIICAITHCDGLPIEAAGVILNISVGGALMATKEPPAREGQRLVVLFRVVLNGIEVLLELNAIVRAINLEQSGDTETPYHLGIQFVDVAPEASVPLLAYVYHELLEQSRRT